MSRQHVFALVGSVSFVAIAFWLVTLMFPAPPSDPIVGKWRHAKASGCSDAEGYILVAKDGVSFNGKGQSLSPIVITAFESDANGPRLRAYFTGNLDSLDFHLPYRIAGNALTFQPSNWTPEARAKHPAEIAQMDATPISPGKTIYKAFAAYQPYHRCDE